MEEFQITSEVITLDRRKPTKEAAVNLNISLDDDVYYVKRIRFIHGQTLCIEESYFNKSIVTYLNKEIITESIFNYITEGLGLSIGFADTYLHVDKLSAEEAEYLGLKKDDPKLEVESVFHLTNGQPFDFSKITYNYVQSQFFFKLFYNLQQTRPLLRERVFSFVQIHCIIQIKEADWNDSDISSR
ncbi:YydK [Planococcus halocryophilus Or1]|nr:YydK [Planococcus halocryophilus Or1]